MKRLVRNSITNVLKTVTLISPPKVLAQGIQESRIPQVELSHREIRYLCV